MACVTISIIALSCVCFVLGNPASDQYTTKYDDFDIDSVLKNDRLLHTYVNCLLDKGTCPAPAEELKKHIPDALLNSCSKCSKLQKDRARVIYDFLSTNKPKLWKQLEAKYDPEGVYVARKNELLKQG